MGNGRCEEAVNEPKTKTATPARGCRPAAPPKLVAIAETIIERRSGAFEPASFRDRYQDALRELVEAKTRGLATTPRAASSRPRSSM
jgi:non-homologous end joining protein Ku